MKTSQKMFLRRCGKRGHEEVLVIIDWSNMSDSDLKSLAVHYVLNRAAHDLKDYDHALPQSVEYLVVDFIHNEPLVNLPPVPENWRTNEPSKAVKSFKEALKGLTPEEVRALLAE